MLSCISFHSSSPMLTLFSIHVYTAFKSDIGGVNERRKLRFHVDTWNPIVENYANLYHVCRFKPGSSVRELDFLPETRTIKNSVCHTSNDTEIWFFWKGLVKWSIDEKLGYTAWWETCSQVFYIIKSNNLISFAKFTSIASPLLFLNLSCLSLFLSAVFIFYIQRIPRYRV